jgi:cyanate permease
MAVIHLTGTPFAGWVFDTTGEYTAAFVTFIGLYLLAAVFVLGIKVNTTSSRAQYESSA